MFIVCLKLKTAYEMRISDWSSDVCSSDLFRSPPGMELRRIDLVRLRASPVADAGMSTADEVRATAAAVTVRPGFVRQLSLMIGAWRASGSGRAIVQRMLIVVLVIGEIGRASCRERVCQYV